ncbi:class I SAM-dependent methyltransferase, partial [Thermodesulfobacteriota bacterium]
IFNQDVKQNIAHKSLWGQDEVTDISSVFRSCLGYAATPGFAFIKQTIESSYGTFSGLKSIELGGGLGKMSVLFSLLGAKTTLVDYSPKQLKRAEYVAKKFQINSVFILKNILQLPKSFSGAYDVSMSFGTAEHFFGVERQKVFHVHSEVLRKGGLCIIWVPNRYGFFYHFGVLARKTFKRAVSKIDEIPFTRKDLRRRAERLRLKEIKIIGGEMLKNDFLNHIFNPYRLPFLRKRNKVFTTSQCAKNALMRKMFSNNSPVLPWNNHFSYPLILIGRRF